MDSVSGLFSIAKKAGYVIVGQDSLLDYDKKLYLIVLDKNAGNNLCKKACQMAEKTNIPLLTVDNLQDMVKISNCKIVGIKNKGLADEIASKLKK